MINSTSRRTFLKQGAGMGLGLSAASAFGEPESPEALLLKHPKAKKLIYLFVDGGLSQIDSFDPNWLRTRSIRSASSVSSSER